MTTFDKPVFVSHHARERLRQRFGLMFSCDNFSHPKITNSLILAQLHNAHLCIKWKMCPFYVNMYGWKYKEVFDVYKHGAIFYIVKDLNVKYLVSTVVKSWHCE